MSRYRLYPTREQAEAMLVHCGHTRYVWNLAVEQLGYHRRAHPAPGYAEQSRQLTEARAAFDWLRAGSSNIQAQALRDFERARSSWQHGTHRRPTWRRRGQSEGFRVVGKMARRIEQLNGHWSQAYIPKVGWVKIRRSRPIPDAKSYRVTLDKAGRWHIAFAAVPVPVPTRTPGSAVGIDRGVAITLACSDGSSYQVPRDRDLRPLHRRLSRTKRGSNRRARARSRLARAYARNADRRRDFVEKASTDLARRFDLIAVEDLRISNMTRSARGTLAEPGRNVRAKSGLNRAILGSGWGIFVRRLDDKAPERVVRVNPAYTSQRCSACGTVDREARESQAAYRCRSCGHASNADVNAARNIEAAGRAVRGGVLLGIPVNRAPQHTFA